MFHYKPPNRPLPKKIQAALTALGITNVVDGYFTNKVPGLTLEDRVKGRYMTAFTCWNKRGEVVCVLVKPNKQEWRKRGN